MINFKYKLFLSYLLFLIVEIKLIHSCLSNNDCSLNGDCVNSSCHCDYGWKGRYCDLLNISYKADKMLNDSNASWGGNAIFSDGKWHLFVAEFVNHCGLNYWGTNSRIIRAEASDIDDEFVYAETVVDTFAHNPTIRQMPNGEFVLYFIGATNPNPINCTVSKGFIDKNGLNNTSKLINSGLKVAHSKSVYGPWDISELSLTNSDGSKELNCSWTNPSPHILPNGTTYLAFTAGYCHNSLEEVGIAISDSWKGPFTLLQLNPVLKTPFFCFSNQHYEDPFLYVNKRGFHMLIHGMCPSGFYNSVHAFSTDGINWQSSPNYPYNYIIQMKNRWYPQILFRLERPQLIFDKENNPQYLINGAREWFSDLSFTLRRKILG